MTHEMLLPPYWYAPTFIFDFVELFAVSLDYGEDETTTTNPLWRYLRSVYAHSEGFTLCGDVVHEADY